LAFAAFVGACDVLKAPKLPLEPDTANEPLFAQFRTENGGRRVTFSAISSSEIKAKVKNAREMVQDSDC
jgi:hypothetical protein